MNGMNPSLIPAPRPRVVAPQTAPITLPAGGQIRQADVTAALDCLGVDPRNLVSVRVDIRAVVVERLARDAEGIIVHADGTPITVLEVHRIVKGSH